MHCASHMHDLLLHASAAWAAWAGLGCLPTPDSPCALTPAGRAANPLAQVLQAIDEPLELIEYNTWNILVPEGEYLTEVSAGCFSKRGGRSMTDFVWAKTAGGTRTDGAFAKSHCRSATTNSAMCS